MICSSVRAVANAVACISALKTSVSGLTPGLPLLRPFARASSQRRGPTSSSPRGGGDCIRTPAICFVLFRLVTNSVLSLFNLVLSVGPCDEIVQAEVIPFGVLGQFHL